MPQTNKFNQKLLPIAILLLAFFLRVIAIDQAPPGLNHDEAYKGLTAIQILEGGERPIFFRINKGIEPLVVYLQVVTFYFLGVGPVQMRLIDVFFGLLTVVLVYPIALRLFRSRQIALLSMVGLTISFWPIFVSRFAFRATSLVPLLMLTLYFFWRALDPIKNLNDTQNRKTAYLQSPTASLTWFILSGIMAGLTMYTYPPSRFLPILIAATFGYYLVILRRIERTHWVGIVVLFALWGAIFAPLALFYTQNSDDFALRYSQVTNIPYALNGDFGPLFTNTIRTLGMFTFFGDVTDRHNLDGRPVFDWVNGLIFYVGLGITVWQLRPASKKRAVAGFLLLWILLMFVSDFITDASPHFLRTIGAMPAIYIIWAVGATALIHQFTDLASNRGWRVPKTAPVVTLSALILFTTLHTSYDYFVLWANSPGTRYIYGADYDELADYVNTHPHESLTAISAEYYQDLDPFRYALYFDGHAPFTLWFDGRQSLAFPPAGSGLEPRYIFPESAPINPVWEQFLQHATAESGEGYDLYHLPGEGLLQSRLQETFPEESRLNTPVNDDLILIGYQILGSVVGGEKFDLLLGWQALRTLPPGTNYTFIARLRDQDDQLWAEMDTIGYDPANWQPGMQGLQLFTIRFDQSLPPNTYNLTIELVNRQTGESLPTSSGETIVHLLTETVE
ncbi:MAG: glycosyltransferase family 39 protein [Chloroflexota bacterium]